MKDDKKKPSAAELRAMLAEVEKEEREELEKARAKYEDDRGNLICGLGMLAFGVAQKISDLKTQAFRDLVLFREEMMKYGDLRRGEKNKGSFMLMNDTWKVEYKTQIIKSFDERAELAEIKLRSFMDTFLNKKAHKGVIEMINSLLSGRRNGGDYDVNIVNRLYAMENSFDHPDWKEALRLFKESYVEKGTARYVRFWKKNVDTNQWEQIILDIASAKLLEEILPTVDAEAEEVNL